LVRVALCAARERAVVERREAALRAWRDSARCEAARRGARRLHLIPM